MAKRGSHGSNYYGTARTMAMHLPNSPQRFLKNFKKIFRGFPEIQQWHQAVATELQSEFSSPRYSEEEGISGAEQQTQKPCDKQSHSYRSPLQ